MSGTICMNDECKVSSCRLLVFGATVHNYMLLEGQRFAFLYHHNHFSNSPLTAGIISYTPIETAKYNAEIFQIQLFHLPVVRLVFLINRIFQMRSLKKHFCLPTSLSMILYHIISNQLQRTPLFGVTQHIEASSRETSFTSDPHGGIRDPQNLILMSIRGNQ